MIALNGSKVKHGCSLGIPHYWILGYIETGINPFFDVSVWILNKNCGNTD